MRVDQIILRFPENFKVYMKLKVYQTCDSKITAESLARGDGEEPVHMVWWPLSASTGEGFFSPQLIDGDLSQRGKLQWKRISVKFGSEISPIADETYSIDDMR